MMAKCNVRRTILIAAICTLLFVATVIGAQAAGPITVHTKFRVPLAADVVDVDAIWLGGFAVEPNEPPQLLGISWARDAGSWVPMWSLHVESHADILQSGTATQGIRMHNLGKSVALPWGHEIETIISYDNEATVSIWIYDVTIGEVIQTASVHVNEFPAEVWPAAGIADRTGVFTPFVDVVGVRAYVPRSAGWAFTHVVDGEPAASGIRRLVRNGDDVEAVAIRLSVPGTAPGTFRFSLEQGSAVVPLLAVDNAAGEQLFLLDMNKLLVGQSRLVMEYDDPGAFYFTEETILDVGEAFVTLQELELIKGAQNNWHLQGVAGIVGDGPLPALNLQLHYDIGIPGVRAPLHQSWQHVVGVDSVMVEPSDGTLRYVYFDIDVGLLPGNAEEQEIFVSVVPQSTGTLRVTHTGGGRFVSGTRTPLFPTINGYDVIRADLHVHTTLSDGQLLPSDRAWESRAYGYDVVSLTDHGTHQAYDFVAKFADDIGLAVIRGLETGRMDGEHFVVLNIDADYVPRHSHKWALQPGGSTVYYQDQVRAIIDHGGMIIYAHPGGNWLPEPLYDHPEVDVGWTDAIEWMLQEGYLHGIEVRGHYGARRRDAPFRWALQHDLTMVDVSDIHEPRNFDAADKAPVSLLFVDELSAAGAMDALWNRRSVMWRDGQLRGTEQWLVPLIETMLEFSLATVDGQTCLQINSNGALPLNGILVVEVTGGRRNVVLKPYETVCLSGFSDGNEATVTWLNVFSEPGKALVTTHVITEQ